ncbi:MAG: hypothetical protein IJU03_08300 [Thermoguttaceae bacterium]|nr:hypothetical protein [Thermoguttaceae bacterium]
MDDKLIVRGWRGKEFPIKGVTKSDAQQALAVLKKVRSALTKARADAIKNFKTTYPNFRRLEEQNRVNKEHPEDCPWNQPLCELYLINWRARRGSQALEELLGLEVEEIC